MTLQAKALVRENSNQDGVPSALSPEPDVQQLHLPAQVGSPSNLSYLPCKWDVIFPGMSQAPPRPISQVLIKFMHTRESDLVK